MILTTILHTHLWPHNSGDCGTQLPESLLFLCLILMLTDWWAMNDVWWILEIPSSQQNIHQQTKPANHDDQGTQWQEWSGNDLIKWTTNVRMTNSSCLAHSNHCLRALVLSLHSIQLIFQATDAFNQVFPNWISSQTLMKNFNSMPKSGILFSCFVQKIEVWKSWPFPQTLRLHWVNGWICLCLCKVSKNVDKGELTWWLGCMEQTNKPFAQEAFIAKKSQQSFLASKLKSVMERWENELFLSTHSWDLL